MGADELDHELSIYVAIIDPALRLVWEKAVDFSARLSNFSQTTYTQSSSSILQS